MEYKLTTNVINLSNTIQTVYSKEHRPQLKSDKNKHRAARSKIEHNILLHLIKRAPPSNHQINNCQYSTNVSLPEKQYIANKQYVDDNSKDCFHCLATKKKNGNRPVEEAKKMKRYKRLIYKQFVKVSGLCGPQFLSYLAKRFTHLCRTLVYQFSAPIWPPEINKNIWSSLFP